MSASTLMPAFDDFDRWESELQSRPRRRAARSTERREAIARSLNVRRHRTGEREA